MMINRFANADVVRDVIQVQLDEGAYMPVREHEEDAGYDLYTPTDVLVPAHGSAVIDTGVHILIPIGFVGMLKSKSGLNVKHDLNGEGVIDAYYTGSIVVKLYNHGDTDKMFEAGNKIIQVVILPIYTPDLMRVDKLPETDRGSNGFGSTGK